MELAVKYKVIGPPRTELWHISVVYIMCPCDYFYEKFQISTF